MIITAVRQQIADQLALALPALKHCKPHPGRFDAAELRRVAAQAPALFLAVLQVSNLTVNSTGIREATLDLGAFIVTKDEAGSPRDSQVLDLSEQILQLLPKQKWATAQTRSVESTSIRAQNLYSGSLDNLGIALWLVSWQQRIEIPKP